MDAPKKIYVSIGPRQSLIAKAGQTLNSDIEYIRKEALREWLEMKTETAEIMVANSVDRWVTRQVYKQVLNKLESM